jgi:CubicO group peptidase (beta-lactamase class C family)
MVVDPVAAADSVEMDAQSLERVRALFQRQIDEGLHPGACLAVYRHGKLVLDLQAGVASQESGQPVMPDTMFVLFSSTKAMTAACLHILWQRGKFAWDDPVAKHWPGFAKNGKDGITIRHVLSHQGGFPETPGELHWSKWQDWDAVVEAMENITPEYAPGQVMAYHPRNYGWVIGELVRRIDGRTFDRFLREEITGPLGMTDTYVGLPEEHEERVATLYAMEDCDRPGMIPPYNRPEVHRAVQPAGGGIATARDLARFYAMMCGGGTLDGSTILAAQTLTEVTRLQVEGLDHSLGQHMRRSLGLVLADQRMGASDGQGARTFGHAGAGTSIGWADPESGLAMAFITNGFRANKTNNPRLESISRAVRQACR